MNSYDARVRYTRMVIEENFLELLRSKPAAQISVTELCQLAQINRATFYKHYKDVRDLQEQMVEQILNQLRDFLESHSYGNIQSMEQMILDVLHYMKQSGPKYFVLGSENADANLAMRSFEICYKTAYPILERNLPQMKQEKREMLYHYLSQGAGGALNCWLRTGMQMDAEEVTQFIMEASTGTVREFISCEAASRKW